MGIFARSAGLALRGGFVPDWTTMVLWFVTELERRSGLRGRGADRGYLFLVEIGLGVGQWGCDDELD